MSLQLHVDLEMTRPLIGYEDLSRFEMVWRNHAVFDLREFDPDAPEHLLAPAPGMPRDLHRSIFHLISSEVPDLGFLALSAVCLVPDLMSVVPRDLLGELDAELGVKAPSDRLVLSLVTKQRHSAFIEANLLAPVVVNVRRRLAAQVILPGCDLPVYADVV